MIVLGLIKKEALIDSASLQHAINPFVALSIVFVFNTIYELA
jgi:hypothetical protein